MDALAALQARAEAALAVDPKKDEEDTTGLSGACVLLPLPEGKKKRTQLHTGIRARFPCLRTVQETAEGKGGGAQEDLGRLHLVVLCDELSTHRAFATRLDPTQTLALFSFVARCVRAQTVFVPLGACSDVPLPTRPRTNPLAYASTN